MKQKEILYFLKKEKQNINVILYFKNIIDEKIKTIAICEYSWSIPIDKNIISYRTIDDVMEKYDIIANFTQGEILPIEIPFRIIKKEYTEILLESKNIEETNNYIIEKYQNRAKSL